MVFLDVVLLKNIQGMLAESGARQAAIVDELMFDTEATEQEFFK